MKTCTKCKKKLGDRSKRTLCMECSKVCECGKSKDFRAKHCKSCGMSLSAKAQWAKGGAILEAVKRAGLARRRMFEHLTLDAFVMTKQQDGRRYAFYWTPEGKKKYIYRYQWIWTMANGPIPTGMEIHHINEDCTDDRLENLQMMSGEDHQRMHLLSGRAENMVRARGFRTGKVEIVCPTCGKTFEDFRSNKRTYCSKDCYRKT